MQSPDFPFSHMYSPTNTVRGLSLLQYIHRRSLHCSKAVNSLTPSSYVSANPIVEKRTCFLAILPNWSGTHNSNFIPWSYSVKSLYLLERSVCVKVELKQKNALELKQKNKYSFTIINIAWEAHAILSFINIQIGDTCSLHFI